MKNAGYSAEKVIAKYNSIKWRRSNFENIWQRIADYMIPRKNDIQKTATPGESKYVDVLDSTGMISLELLANALHGMLTNPAGYFFTLTTGLPELDDTDAARKWIQDVVRRMHYRLNNSNFQTEVQEYYLDLIGFGTAVMDMEEDPETVVRFGARPLREIYIDENSKGFVDCVYRCYEMDARGLVDDFGLEKLPEKVQKDYRAGKDTKYEILHAVYPVPKLAKNKKSAFKFVSQYILVADKVEIESGGFKELPYIVSRWSKASGEVYGRGPGEKALPEVQVLNKMTETTLRGAQKTIDPPLQAPDDGFVIPLQTKPAGVNYYRAGSEDRITPIFADARIDFGFQAIDRKQMQVREAFYVDQLKLREGPQMTATEVNERIDQAFRFMGPMIGRQNPEFLQPMVERLYAIMHRKGEIPEPPPELDGRELKVQFSSVIALLQRTSEIQSIRSTMQDIAPFGAIDPSVFDNFDGDVASHVIAKLRNFPQDLLRDQKAVTMIRQQRAEQQQQMMQAEMDKNQADSTSKLMGAAAKARAPVA